MIGLKSILDDFRLYEADDDKYASIGFGRFKLKGKEDDEDADVYVKTDSGKYEKSADQSSDDKGAGDDKPSPKKAMGIDKSGGFDDDDKPKDEPSDDLDSAFDHKGGGKLRKLAFNKDEDQKDKLSKIANQLDDLKDKYYDERSMSRDRYDAQVNRLKDEAEKVLSGDDNAESDDVEISDANSGPIDRDDIKDMLKNDKEIVDKMGDDVYWDGMDLVSSKFDDATIASIDDDSNMTLGDLKKQIMDYEEDMDETKVINGKKYKAIKEEKKPKKNKLQETYERIANRMVT